MRRSTLKGIIAICVAALLGSAYVITSLAFNKQWNPLKWGKKVEAVQPDKNDGDGDEKEPAPTTGELVNEIESNGIRLMSARISPDDYEAYGIEAQADTAYSVTATVNEDAADKSVVGSVAWKNPDSEWASGKRVSEYLTLKQTEQYGLEFTFTVRTSFSEPIIFTVASCTDRKVNASCQIDYLKKLQSFTAVLNPNYGSDYGRINVGDNMNTIQITPKFGNGTVEGTISGYKTTFTTNDYFRTELKTRLDMFTSSKGGTFTPAEKITVTGQDFKINWQGSSLSGTTAITGLCVGGGPSPNIVINNFIKERGMTTSTGSFAYTAGVTCIEYEVTYSYGDEYSATKTYKEVNTDDMFKDDPTNFLYGFRNDNLTLISTINNIQLDKDGFVII